MADTFSIFTALDANGDPIGGAKLNFYLTGTTTRADTFTDNALSVAHTNPVVADASGRFAPIYLVARQYKVVFTDASDVTLWTFDPLQGGVGTIRDANKNEVLEFGSVANAVNHWSMSNAIAGNAPVFEVVGTDANINGVIRVKGTGGFVVNNSAGASLLQVTGGANIANWPDIRAASTGNAVVHAVEGSDAATQHTWATRVASAEDNRAHLADGFWMEGATGGDQGAGTINATAVSRNGIEYNRGWSPATTVATTSGTTHALLTGLSSVEEIEVWFDGVLQDTNDTILQLIIGDTDGLETTGYSGYCTGERGATTPQTAMTSGFNVTDATLYDVGATFALYGYARMVHLGSNKWAVNGQAYVAEDAGHWQFTGYKTLTAELDRLELTTSLGTASFTNGSVSVRHR